MIWRKYDGEGGWYGPGLHLARSRNNRSHWVNMGARLWKCSREQMGLATDEEGLSKEVALALSQEMLDDVDSGRSARFIHVTSDGAPSRRGGAHPCDGAATRTVRGSSGGAGTDGVSVGSTSRIVHPSFRQACRRRGGWVFRNCRNRSG